jgi:hypothetical protein
MKTFRHILFLIIAAMALNACSLFKPKVGCPVNGRNVGAERLLGSEKVKDSKFKVKQF